MSMMRAASLLVAMLWVWGLAAAAANRPKPPVLLRPPAILTAGDELRLKVRIEPHRDVDAVVAEMWEAEAVDLFLEPVRLVRASREPVTGNQRVFTFHWRPLSPGLYALYAKVATGQGLTYSSPPHQLEVR